LYGSFTVEVEAEAEKAVTEMQKPALFDPLLFQLSGQSISGEDLVHE